MQPFLIATFSQYANGKDELSNYLCESLNKQGTLHWKRNALASNVKRIFMDAFGVDTKFIEEWKRKDEIPEGFDKPVRESLTFIGDGFRGIKGNVWIDKLLNHNKENLIISDGRYTNEAKYIQDHNGITILLWRPGFENDYPSKSEQELMPFVRNMKECSDGEIFKEMPFDLWIKNDGTLNDLYGKIDNIIVPFVEKFVLSRSRCC